MIYITIKTKPAKTGSIWNMRGDMQIFFDVDLRSSSTVRSHFKPSDEGGERPVKIQGMITGKEQEFTIPANVQELVLERETANDRTYRDVRLSMTAYDGGTKALFFAPEFYAPLLNALRTSDGFKPCKQNKEETDITINLGGQEVEINPGTRQVILQKYFVTGESGHKHFNVFIKNGGGQKLIEIPESEYRNVLRGLFVECKSFLKPTEGLIQDYTQRSSKKITYNHL